MSRITEFMPRLATGYAPDLQPGELIVALNDAKEITSFWFICPCNECGDTMMVPSAGYVTNKDHEPVWQLTAEDDGTFSASPSILRRGGCGSHFYITRCVVVWC